MSDHTPVLQKVVPQLPCWGIELPELCIQPETPLAAKDLSRQLCCYLLQHMHANFPSIHFCHLILAAKALLTVITGKEYAL